MFTGSLRVKRRVERKSGIKWSELRPEQRSGDIFKKMVDRRSYVSAALYTPNDTRKANNVQDFLNHFRNNGSEVGIQPGGEYGYVDYSELGQSVWRSMENSLIHETTHGLVDSGKWKEREREFLNSAPHSELREVERFPQERERKWKEEIDNR